MVKLRVAVLSLQASSETAIKTASRVTAMTTAIFFFIVQYHLSSVISEILITFCYCSQAKCGLVQ